MIKNVNRQIVPSLAPLGTKLPNTMRRTILLASLLALLTSGCTLTIPLQRQTTQQAILDAEGPVHPTPILLQVSGNDLDGKLMHIHLTNGDKITATKVSVHTDSTYFLPKRAIDERTIATDKVDHITLKAKPGGLTWMGMGLMVGGMTMMGIGASEQENLYRAIGYFYGGILVGSVGAGTILLGGLAEDKTIVYRVD